VTLRSSTATQHDTGLRGAFGVARHSHLWNFFCCCPRKSHNLHTKCAAVRCKVVRSSFSRASHLRLTGFAGAFAADADGSPALGPTLSHDQTLYSDEEEEYSPDLSDPEAGSGDLAQGFTGASGTADGTSIETDDSGMLPRDKQRKTAFYDYTAEKQMSHTEAKQFYQRHQWETQHGGSQAGDGYSPALRAKTFPANFGAADGMSIRSRKSNVSLANQGHQHSVHAFGQSHYQQSQGPRSQKGSQAGDVLLQADQEARAHSKHPALPHEDKPLLTDEGIHGAGAGIGVGSGAGGFAMSDSSVTAELSAIYTNVQKVLDLRHKYIRLSLQHDFDNPRDDPGWKIYHRTQSPCGTTLQRNAAMPQAACRTAQSLSLPRRRQSPLARWEPISEKTSSWKIFCRSLDHPR